MFLKYININLIFLTTLIFFNACGNSKPKIRETNKNNTTKPKENSSNNKEIITYQKTISYSKAKNHPLSSWSLENSSNIKFAKVDDNISDFSKIIYNNHPRLLFRDSDLDYLLSSVNDSNNLWRVIEQNVHSRFPKNISMDKALEKLDSGVLEENDTFLLYSLLQYLKYNDTFYKDITISWAMKLSSPDIVLEGNRNDIPLRVRIQNLSKIYDWFYHDLSVDQKERIKIAIKRNLDQLNSFGYMNDPLKENFIQSHSRWARGVVAEANLALYGDFDENYTKEYADRELKITREKILKYFDTERYIAIDGGWHLGWAYAYFNANYTFNYLVWTTATKETFLDDWMGELAYWFIYGLRGDDSFLRVGDAYATNNMSIGVLANAYNAKFRDDPYSQWYLEKNLNSPSIYDSQLSILFILQNRDLLAKKPSDLPKSRIFKNVGVVIARDNWDKNCTHFYFKSSPFYSAGHHHRDENSFALHYKIPLALDTGVYDYTDSNHYKNYYIRTVAHNAITIFNPNQKFYYYTDYNRNDSLKSKEIANDGGQIFKKDESLSLSDILPGKRNSLIGITHYQYNKNSYTYMLGDATKAYDPKTVLLAKREIFFVLDSGFAHPVTIILDRVKATDGSFKKRYLLHTDSTFPPVLDQANQTIYNKIDGVDKDNNPINVTLTNITLFPKDVEINIKGGKDKEFSYYEDDTTNYRPLKDEYEALLKNNKTRAGKYRLEISPKPGNRYDNILNVLLISESDSFRVSKDTIRSIESDDIVGVLLKNRAFIFPKDEGLKESLSFSLNLDKRVRFTLSTKYPKNSTFSYYLNSKKLKDISVGDGGCIDFEGEFKKGDKISLVKN